MSVRNNKNKVIQFQYGTDGINTMRVENNKLPMELSDEMKTFLDNLLKK